MPDACGKIVVFILLMLYLHSSRSLFFEEGVKGITFSANLYFLFTNVNKGSSSSSQSRLLPHFMADRIIPSYLHLWIICVHLACYSPVGWVAWRWINEFGLYFCAVCPSHVLWLVFFNFNINFHFSTTFDLYIYRLLLLLLLLPKYDVGNGWSNTTIRTLRDKEIWCHAESHSIGSCRVLSSGRGCVLVELASLGRVVCFMAAVSNPVDCW